MRFIVFLLCVSGLNAVLAADAPRVNFNRDIRPILSDNCFQCHGPDEKQRHGKLRLDSREPTVVPAESGKTAIVPGKPTESELLRRVLSDDKDTHMPPASSGKQLKPREIELLKRWVAEGAEYQGHWAFIAPQRPELPAVKNAAFSKNAIDRFILARLEREGFSPSKEARKETLIRRVSLDLTGIPPTPGEVDAFLADRSAEAYEKVVERLLQSPRYGERMAMQWLDFARYADSNGYQVDSSRDMWPWREWVIKAFNDNMPFDQFTVEQLAGDLLPEPTQSQLVATGFNRNHRITGEGGSIAEEWRVETVIDRVETTGMTWLALTFNCCRCHDHKYDPLSQKDFFAFYAFFNNVPESGLLGGEGKNTEPTISVLTAEYSTQLAKFEAAIKDAQARSVELEKQLPQLIAAWEPKFREHVGSEKTQWEMLEPKSVVSAGGATLKRQDDGAWLASDTNPDHDVYTITAPLAAGSLSALLLETFPDSTLPNQSNGRFPNGNYVLTAFEAEVSAPSFAKPLLLTFARAEADYSQKGWEIGLVNDGKPAGGWAIDGPTKRENRKAIFALGASVTVPAEATITVRMKHEALAQHNIGRFRLAATGLPADLVRLDGAKTLGPIVAIVNTPAEKRTPAQVAELTKYFRANGDSPLKAIDAEVAAASKKLLYGLKGGLPTVMVMREMPQPRDAFLLVRGQYDKRGDKVTAALPAALPPMPDGQPMNRLGLAKWMIDPSNPLTSRVWVNRIWEKFFGTGLVKTSENLGSQSEFPSHPELLDWLAIEFMHGSSGEGRGASEKGRAWDMKALQKLIVMSATYRQDAAIVSSLPSALGPQPSAVSDPENRLLARGPRFRLAGELVRDQALAVSGLMVEKLGGPSVRPYMPDGVWDETSRYGNLRGYKHDQGEGLYRRTLYTIWKRTAAPPTLLLFDAPSRETCVVKRSRTNTPLQALVLLNEVTYVEAARKLAERMLSEGGTTPDDRLAYGFRLATARRPTAAELRVLVAGFNADIARFRETKDAATKLVATGDFKADAKFNVEELAAYALTANVLLNLDEVVTRE